MSAEMPVDVYPFLASDTEVGVCLTLWDGSTVYLTTEQADVLVEAIYDTQAVDPAILHSELAVEKRHDHAKDQAHD